MASLCYKVIKTIVKDLAFSDIVKLFHICCNLCVICKFIIQYCVWLSLADIVDKKYVKIIYNIIDCLYVVSLWHISFESPQFWTICYSCNTSGGGAYHYWFVQKIHKSEQASIARYLILRNLSTSFDHFLMRFLFLLVCKGLVVKDFLSPIRQRMSISTRFMSSKSLYQHHFLLSIPSSDDPYRRILC